MCQIELGCSRNAYSNVSCIESERNALLQVRHSLIDRSNRLSLWMGKDCCTWEGVVCNESSGRVVMLDLHNKNSFDPKRLSTDESYLSSYGSTLLGGEISPSILNLEHLHYLDLSMNNFSGIQIPSFLGSFKSLEYLNLSGAGFHGKIPDHLANLSSLKTLYIGNAESDWDMYLGDSYRWVANSLWWLAGLSSLQRLALSGVNLTGTQDWLYAINMLPSLHELKLSGCGLYTIPSLSYVNFTSLNTLDLNHNDFSSTLPLWLSNMTFVERLHLRENHFNGQINDTLGKLTSLSVLHLSSNNFSSSLQNALCNLSSLVQIDLSYNNFHGSLPSCIGNLSSLFMLRLQLNHFEGPIPSEIGKLKQLTDLNLDHNDLNGAIPPSLWQLSRLQVLDLSCNSLNGQLSEAHFANHKELRSLSISSTRLSFDVSSLWVPPFQLKSIKMDSIGIGPQFPLWLRTQKRVQKLSLSNASIYGTIPNWFGALCSHINFLDLSHNHLSGKVPDFIDPYGYQSRSIFLDSNNFEGTLKSFPLNTVKLDFSRNHLTGHVPSLDDKTTSLLFRTLILAENSFIGSIPESFCNMQNLHMLVLACNELTGKIPSCLGNLRHLSVLNLRNNSFHGHIPSSLGSLELLSYLHLNRNQFDGELPTSLQNLKNLLVLDLGENRLRGIIPSWIGEKLLSLIVLRLQSNDFCGNISLQICRLSKLQVLNLAKNNLTGFIPQCFGNFSAMGLDGSEHAFAPNIARYLVKVYDYKKGIELAYTSNLKYLKSIMLSQNHIIGEIPDQLMDLVGLQSLNLSNNNLSGRIPEKIGNLKQLESLDLSTNRISGPIPQSLSTINSLSFLNLSFNKLSGQIPPGNQIQTLNDPSIYAGNLGLCGKPLLIICHNDKSPSGNRTALDLKGREDSDFLWFYSGIGPGFAIGFLGFFGLLLSKKSWRNSYFKFLTNAYNKIAARPSNLA